MSGFSGFEPQVGEIRAVRTFRLGPGGELYPLFSERPWKPDANMATCRVSRDAEHVSPDPDCTCGFYAYADEQAAGEYPFARYLLAVVACWGRVIAGTRGVRVQYARVEAIWVSDRVPDYLVRLMRERHGAVAVYTDREQMLREHPATPLDVYEPVTPTGSLWPPRPLPAAVAASAVVVGLLPVHWLRALPYGWWVWGVTLAAVLLGAFVRGHRANDAVLRRRRMLCIALAFWMLAPLAGVTGFVFLRLPLLQVTALAAAQRVAMNRVARTFPARI